MAVSSPSSSVQSTMEKYGIKPLTKSNILEHYAPLFGVANYGVLAINVMNPNWMVKISPKRDVTNFLLLGSVVGTGLYMANTKLVKSAPKQKQILYSACGSLLFTFGSVLLWAVLRNILPDNKLLAVSAGVVSGATLTVVSKEYLEYIDSKLK
ncbi:uncharacterized protein LOC128983215 [Macrosteles quadrilineatus]|uniref:uncharacterized protein LOC128983215 n=1 Tax=Macrosteles quadrilineatus TaxID=74068 RepID=UPI0023E2D569|nr:uncharacterized protein LOC128983215 [Macrosteles quadrilineatus]